MPFPLTAVLAAFFSVAPSGPAGGARTVELATVPSYLSTVLEGSEYPPVHAATPPTWLPFSWQGVVPGACVGASRAALLRHWTTEGGIRTRTRGRYLLRDPETGDPARDRQGRFTRIRVTFDPVGTAPGSIVESPHDRILRIDGPAKDYGIIID